MTDDDLQRLDPERRINSLILKVTPKIFEWFGWIAALGAIQFVYARTRSNVAFALLLTGYVSLFLYTYALLSTWINYSFIKKPHNREFASAITALLLAYFTFYIAQQAITAFSLSAL